MISYTISAANLQLVTFQNPEHKLIYTYVMRAGDAIPEENRVTRPRVELVSTVQGGLRGKMMACSG